MTASAALTDQMASLGYSPDQIQQMIAADTGLSVDAQNEVLSAASTIAKGGLNLGTLNAVVGSALTTVNPVFGMAYAAGISLAQGLAGLLNGDQHYDWYVGHIGKHKPIPYGPNAANWQKFADFVQMVDNIHNGPGGNIVLPGTNYRDLAIEGLASIMNPSDANAKTPEGVFYLLYKAAWKLNAELLINGHNWVDPYLLLMKLEEHWNATHQPGSGFTFNGNGTTYIDYLIKGDYTDQPYDPMNHPPITIHTGAALAPTPKAPPVTQSAPKTFLRLGGSATPSQDTGIQHAAVYWATGENVPIQNLASVYNALVANGISQAKYESLPAVGQNLIRIAAIPVVATPSFAVGGAFRPTAAAPAASSGPSVATIGLVALAGAAVFAGFKLWQGRSGGMTP